MLKTTLRFNEGDKIAIAKSAECGILLGGVIKKIVIKNHKTIYFISIETGEYTGPIRKIVFELSEKDSVAYSDAEKIVKKYWLDSTVTKNR